MKVGQFAKLTKKNDRRHWRRTSLFKVLLARSKSLWFRVPLWRILNKRRLVSFGELENFGSEKWDSLSSSLNCAIELACERTKYLDRPPKGIAETELLLMFSEKKVSANQSFSSALRFQFPISNY